MGDDTSALVNKLDRLQLPAFTVRVLPLPSGEGLTPGMSQALVDHAKAWASGILGARGV